jgi:anaerobic selenocysteine-containing dehydrogenase
MRLTRRSFIQASATTATLLAAGCATAPRSAIATRKANGAKPAQGEWIASTCQGCTQWCAIEVFNQNGRAVRVRGNQNSRSNHGYVCPRGHLIPQQLYSPDRIKVPMKRTNPLKGRYVDPKWVPISWDEALDTVADKMLELRRGNETQKFTYLRGRYSSTGTALLYGTVGKVFGSPNNFTHSAICAEAEKMGPGLTQGFYGYRDYDLGKTDCLVCWGVDPLSSNREVPNTMVQFPELLKRGAKVIVVDPRLTNVAIKGHEWLPLKPGTDGALAAAIAHVLLVEGLWNREFVGDFKDGKNLFVAGKLVDEAAFAEKETHGLIKWWNIELKDRTPAFAAKETQLPVDQIVRVARMMGKAAPKVAVWMGPGPVMTPRGTYTAMITHSLNGLLGSIDAEGGTLQTSGGLPLGRFPSSDAFMDDMAKAAAKGKKLDGRGDKDMPAMMRGIPGSGVVTNNVANGMLKDPGAVKVMMASWANFNFSCTGAQRWDQVMAKVPFFVHMVTDPSEMTQFADIVLPSTFCAAEGLTVISNNANLHSYASIQQPVVKRLWDVKQEETEVVWLLAKKLKDKGYPNLFDYYASFKDPETGKTPTNELEFTEIAAKISSATIWMPKEPLKGEKISGWAEFRKRGMASGPSYAFKRGWGGKFNTPTKKFEFYSEALKKGLQDHAKKYNTTVDDIMSVTGYTARGEQAFVPHYEAPKRHGSVQEYPFDFVDYKSRLNREGRSANLPWYHEFKKVDPGDMSGDDVLKMNPVDGRKLGLKSGEMVKVTSPNGSMTVKLKLWEGVRPGTVTKSFGQGHWAYGRVAAEVYGKKARGGNNNEILVDDYDRLSGSTARNGGFTGVRVTKA